MKVGTVWRKVALGLGLLAFLQAQAQKRVFVHPGITYTRADLDRMRAMVEARQEPFYTTFQQMLKDGYSQIGDGNYPDVTQIGEGRFNATIGSDGRRAHDMALLYHITGNKAYADDAVKRLNRYNHLVNASSRGTAPLDNGKIYMLIEAAELLRDYEGWRPEDQEAFKKMLVYPFYSTKVAADSHKSSVDDENGVSFYWNIYDFDPGRFGNQGLFAARGLMAMGIYLDNDTIYDRAYRYLACLPGREDDLPYRPGPPVQDSLISEDEFKRDYDVTWPDEGEEYHSDEALRYYIYRNGQCQESCRDQSHTMGGIGNYTAIAEMAWNQGDSLYGWLDDRILKGIEFSIRYNLSAVESFPDQARPWEPSAYTPDEEDCTFENGKFYQAVSRSKRWEAKGMSSVGRGEVFGTGGWKTQALEHYRVRAGVPADGYVWLQRAYDKMMADYGHENWGVAPNWYYEWTGWGTLTKKRTDWMAGDAGTWEEGRRVSGMPAAPCVIKAADYDFYTGDGEMHTYHNVGKERSSVYRTDGTVEIGEEGEDVYVKGMEHGEWMSYTLVFPAPDDNMEADVEKRYNVYATYRSRSAGAKLFVAVDGGKRKGKELRPSEGWTEKLLGTLAVRCGAAVLRVYVQGECQDLDLKELRVAPLEKSELKPVDIKGKAVAVNVYDANGNDKTEESVAALDAATDGVKDKPIGLKHQYFLVYDFGEEGLEMNRLSCYNDGTTQDTREQMKVLGNTSGGAYEEPWNQSEAKDVLRTNGRIYDGIPVLENAWLTEGGAVGSYTVGPVGKYRYLSVYNWSAACNISELEVWSNADTVEEEEDDEPSAEWEDGGDGVKGTVPPPAPSVSVFPAGRCICIYASEDAGFSVSGVDGRVVGRGRVSGGNPFREELPPGAYMVRVEARGKVYVRKVLLR